MPSARVGSRVSVLRSFSEGEPRDRLVGRAAPSAPPSDGVRRKTAERTGVRHRQDVRNQRRIILGK